MCTLGFHLVQPIIKLDCFEVHSFLVLRQNKLMHALYTLGHSAIIDTQADLIDPWVIQVHLAF